jgi:hypothetical protein
MLIWGGVVEEGNFDDGAAYDPSSDSWTSLPRARLSGRFGHTAAWTGEEMMIWGSNRYFPKSKYFSNGASWGPCEAPHDRPVVFVHGIDADPRDGWGADGHNWRDMKNVLQRQGWCSSLVSLAYYEGDKNFDDDIDPHGDHGRHHGGRLEHTKANRHTGNTDLRHIAYHWAWFVYDRFTKKGISIDAVAHSQGGLIMRYALAQVERGNKDFPDHLYVEDVVTLGTPHAGSAWASLVSLGCKAAVQQCDQLRPTSSFILWLALKAQDPQALRGTDWTVIGSRDDQVVKPHDSAVAMDAAHKVMYLDGNHIGHGAYMYEISNELTADVRYLHRGGEWTEDLNALWPVRWADLALSTEDR